MDKKWNKCWIERELVLDDNFDIGIDNIIYQNFYHNLSKNPEKILKKFHLMMLENDIRYKTLKNQYFYHQNFYNLKYWLDYLANFSACNINFNNFCQTELFYSRNDNIVNYQQGELFQKKMPNAKLHISKDYSHIIFDLNLT